MIDVTTSDAQARINDGFAKVIAATYTNLSMLGGKTFSEQSLNGLVYPAEGMFGESFSILEVPADDMLGHLEMRGKRHEMVTMKQLVDRYSAKPFGWDQWSIAAVVAHHAGQSKIELQIDGKTLARTEITGTLRNTQRYPNIVVAPQRVYDQKIVNAFRKFVIEFTNDGSLTKDAAELGRVGKEQLESKLVELQALRSGAAAYPFIDQLDEPIRLLGELISNNSDWFLERFNEAGTTADELLDAKDNAIDPIMAFLNGNQRSIYDNATEFMQLNRTNLAFLTTSVSDGVEIALEDPQIFRGSKTMQLGAAIANLESQLGGIVSTEREAAIGSINDYWKQVPVSAAFEAATEASRESVARKVDAVLARVRRETQISAIRDLAAQFADTAYPAILDELESTRQPQDLDLSLAPEAASTADGPVRPKQPLKQSVSIKKLSLPRAGGLLETEDDINTYLGELRSLLVNTINDNKRITL